MGMSGTWGTLSTRGSLLDLFGGALRVHLTCDLVYLGEFLLAKRSKLETPSVMAFMAPATATFSWLLDLSDLWSGVVRSWNSSFFAWDLFLTTICTLRLSSHHFLSLDSGVLVAVEPRHWTKCECQVGDGSRHDWDAWLPLYCMEWPRAGHWETSKILQPFERDNALLNQFHSLVPCAN